MSASTPALDKPYAVVAMAHADEISSGLREAANLVADVLDKIGGEAFGLSEKHSLTDGIFAIAQALERIAEAMERRKP
jgi:hypothetical protein